MIDLHRIDPCSGDYGQTTLPYGNHQVDVSLGYTPDLVYLATDDTNYQVCGGSPSTTAAATVPGGFTITAVVRSDWSTVAWVAYRYWC